LGIRRVVVPPLPGHFSAVGLLVADERHDYVRSWLAPLAAVSPAALEAAFAAMEAEGAAVLEREGVPPARRLYRRSLDLRYRGQAHTLGVPLDDPRDREAAPAGGRPLDAAALAATRARFDAAHAASYGHAAPDEPVELLNLRLVALGRGRALTLPEPTLARTDEVAAPSSRQVGLDEGAW